MRVVSFMAGGAAGVPEPERVFVGCGVQVATETGGCPVSPGQRKRRFLVMAADIELGRKPVLGGVAVVAYGSAGSANEGSFVIIHMT